jgi:hypothetical protein
MSYIDLLQLLYRSLRDSLWPWDMDRRRTELVLIARVDTIMV